MAARFNKEAMLEYLTRRVEYLQKKHKFDARDGYAQARGKDVEVAVDYGAFRAMLDIIQEIEGGYIKK